MTYARAYKIINMIINYALMYMNTVYRQWNNNVLNV